MSLSLYGGNSPRGATGNAAGIKAPRGYETYQQYTPEQMDLFQRLFSHVGPESYLSRLAGGDEASFRDIERPALRQFSGLQGNIASRFSGSGGGQGALGSRRSSGFQNTMNQYASDFAQQLQSQRQGLQQQAIRDLLGLSGQLLEKSPYGLVPKKKSFLEELLGSLAGGIGQAGGAIGSMYGLNRLGG